MEPLQTTCLNGVSHQHAMQDLTSSATLHHPAPREAIGDYLIPQRLVRNVVVAAARRPIWLWVGFARGRDATVDRLFPDRALGGKEEGRYDHRFA